MSKYHPIDVRYNGPSTAYRGSAKRMQNQPLKARHKAVPVTHPPRQQQPTQRTSQSPWGAKYRSETPQPRPPRPQKSAAPAVAAKTAMRGIGGVFNVFFAVVKTLKYIYFAFIALVFIIAFLL
ncbi:hypothetical protein [Loktanella sp. Alg231-35]|uniref:hypothetical protein n=1 Tax=Loktanella sp. Alg231-35 TaxID=1922220 RepID=UPI00131EDCE9|nr:hypothetical protein [Loktanella sp. Alg231-35]